MGDRSDVKQGTLALMMLKTLQLMGPLHGYGIARRIEQTSGQQLAINYGTIYPGAAQARAGRGYRGRLGRVRQQPQGEVLPADPGRAQARRTGNARVGADVGHSRPVPVRRRTVVMRRGARVAPAYLVAHRPHPPRREFSDELAAHLEMHVEDNVRAGMSAGEARRQALPRWEACSRRKSSIAIDDAFPGSRSLSTISASHSV